LDGLKGFSFKKNIPVEGWKGSTLSLTKRIHIYGSRRDENLHLLEINMPKGHMPKKH